MSWKKTAVPCLYLEENSGRYYGRIYTDGEATWQSLHTDSFGVAKRRLPDKQKELRLMSERRAHHDGINGVTVADLARVYLRSEGNPCTKVRDVATGY